MAATAVRPKTTTKLTMAGATHVMVTGSRNGPTSYQSERALEVLADWARENVILHHGDCTGFDAWVAKECARLLIPVVLHPSNDRRWRAYTGSMANVIDTRPPKPPLKRNADMVRECTQVLAAPAAGRSVGTLWTVSHAQQQKRDVTVLSPNKEMEMRT